MKKKNAILSSIFLMICFLVIGQSTVSADLITIGIVNDGDSYFDEIIPLVKEELKKHLEDTQKINFKRSDEFNAKWERKKVRGALTAALNDPDVDYILVTGPFTTQEALTPSRNLTKPVLSSFVQMSDVFIPSYTEEGRSKTKNASFILVPDRVLRDIESFNDMIGFNKLHILVSELDKDFLNFIKKILPKYEEKTGIELELLAVSADDLEGSLNALQDSKAVYITYMPQLTRSQRKQMIEIINRRKIPSFSMLGHSDVHLGVLAAQTPDMIQQVVRRTALNISELIRGADINSLSVILPVDTALMINGETAASLNYVPNLETQISATIINSEFLDEAGGNLTLQEAFKLAEEGNTSLSIKDSDVETAKQSKNLALSGLLPQVNTGANYAKVDDNRAETLSTVSEELSRGTVSVSQVIFNDETFSDLRSSKRLFEGSQEDRETARLDAMADGGTAFLQYSLARELYRIETDNLRVTEDNLELAKLRYDVGHSGKDEVYRWQSELYQDKQSLFESKADVEAQRIAFNQVLGAKQDKRWQPIRVDVNPEDFAFLGGSIRNVIKRNHVQKESIREYLVQFALNQAPEIKFIQKSKEAKKIELDQLSRRFLLPILEANFDYSNEIERTGERFAGLDDDEYQVTIAASYPLFEGGGKYYKVKKARSELENLEKQIQLAEEITEQNTRTAIRSIESSFPSINFSLLAADSARKNLDIVQEKYAQGTVNVTDLIEAQNQSFTADQNAAIALYSYLTDLVGFQRSIAWFEDDQTESEKNNFIEDLTEYISTSKK